MKKICLYITCITIFTCIGKPIKSNISGRNSILAQESNESINPYITDGLVAWYDGEWNAGLGKHDNNIGYWMNLMTEIPATAMSGNISFTNNALIVQKQAFSICLNCYEAVYAITNGIFTIECTGYMEELAATRFYWLNDQPNTRYPSSSGITLMTHSSQALFITQRLGNMSSLVSHDIDYPPCCGVGTWRIDINQQQNNSAMFYKNGSYTTRRQLTASPILTNINLYIVANDKGPIGKFYCLRIYNRRLNEKEIQHNYEIDRARFNLP